MTTNVTIPQTDYEDLTPRIAVIGVGGGGTKAVDYMIEADLQRVEFTVVDTDIGRLRQSRAVHRICSASDIADDRGAAGDDISQRLDGVHMAFVVAGMGGDTGTLPAPTVARMANERGILTVGVQSWPFELEGVDRCCTADGRIAEMQRYTDTLIVIPSQRLLSDAAVPSDAFKQLDHAIYNGVRCITDLIIQQGLIGIDFADVRLVLEGKRQAGIGRGQATGHDRAIRAAELAIADPLLENIDIGKAVGTLITITGGSDLTLFEADQAANTVRERVGDDTDVVFGCVIEQHMTEKFNVSVLVVSGGG